MILGLIAIASPITLTSDLHVMRGISSSILSLRSSKLNLKVCVSGDFLEVPTCSANCDSPTIHLTPDESHVLPLLAVCFIYCLIGVSLTLSDPLSSVTYVGVFLRFGQCHQRFGEPMFRVLVEIKQYVFTSFLTGDFPCRYAKMTNRCSVTSAIPDR